MELSEPQETEQHNSFEPTESFEQPELVEPLPEIDEYMAPTLHLH
jgi:hypothetical protein